MGAWRRGAQLAYGPPTVSRSVGTIDNVERFADLVRVRAIGDRRRARILIVGGARAGVGLERHRKRPGN